MPLRPQTVSLLLPEITLIVSATLIIVGGAFWQARGTWTTIAALAIVVAGIFLVPTGASFFYSAWEMTEGPVVVDLLAITGRWLSLAFGLTLVLSSARRSSELQGGELPGLLLMLTAGMSLTCWAGNMVLQFLALELISIPSYIILFIGRNDRQSAESAVKYFLLSIMSSAILLMGFMLLYGVTGTVDFGVMIAQLAELGEDRITVLSIAMLMAFAGLSFKLAVVPLHFYAPDVYQSTTNVNAGLLAIAPKLAALVALLRLLSVSHAVNSALGWYVVVIVAVISMTLGNIVALWQRNLRRMLAYSSIAHGGYLLMGVAVGMLPMAANTWWNGFGVALFYVIVYGAATVGIFAALEELSSTERDVSTIDDVRGLWWQRPVIAGALAVCLFSLTGIPPLAGFWGKLGLIGAVLQGAGETTHATITKWLLALAMIAMVNAAIAAAYYLRIIASAFFRDGVPCRDAKQVDFGMAGVTACIAALVCIGLGIGPGPTANHTRRVGESLVQRSGAEASPPAPLAQRYPHE